MAQVTADPAVAPGAPLLPPTAPRPGGPNGVGSGRPAPPRDACDDAAELYAQLCYDDIGGGACARAGNAAHSLRAGLRLELSPRVGDCRWRAAVWANRPGNVRRRPAILELAGSPQQRDLLGEGRSRQG